MQKTTLLFFFLVLTLLPLIPLSLLYVTAETKLAASVPAQTSSDSPLSISISPGSAVMDEGQFETFNSSVTGGSSANWYICQWFFNGNPVSGAIEPTWMFTPTIPGSYTVYAEATDSSGAQTTSNTATVTVNSWPWVSVSPFHDGIPIIMEDGQSQTFSATVTGGTPPYSYQWSTQFGQLNGTGSTYTFTATQPGYYGVSVEVTDEAGASCNSMNDVSGGMVWVLGTELEVGITPDGANIANAASMVVGQSMTFTATAYGGTPPYTLEWSSGAVWGGGFQGTAQGSIYTFTATQPGDYYVAAIVDDSAGAYATNTAAVLVWGSQYSLDVSTSAAVADLGQPVVFNVSEAEFSEYLGLEEYNWRVNGVVVPPSSPGDYGSNYGPGPFVFVPGSAGDYTVDAEATIPLSLGGGENVISNAVTVTVADPPSETVSPSSATLAVGKSQLFTANITGGVPPYSYQWYSNGFSVSGATDSSWTFTPYSTGSYWVYVDVTDSVGGYTAPSVVPITVGSTSFQVTFTEAGLAEYAYGTVVTVNGTSIPYSSLPYSIWVNGGDSLSYSYTNLVSSSLSGEHFKLNGVSGPSSPFTVTGPTTVTGNYTAQYLVAFVQSGLNVNASGNVVTVDGSETVFGDLPFSKWVNNGASVNYSYEAIVLSISFSLHAPYFGERFRLDDVTGPASPITVTSPVTVTGNYVTQYCLLLDTSPSDVKDYLAPATSPPDTDWYDEGTYASISAPKDVPVKSGLRYDFRGWTTDDMSEITNPSAASTAVLMDQGKTVTANYVAQYYLTLKTNPAGVNGPSGEGWYDNGTRAPISTPQDVNIVSGSSRYDFRGWQDGMSEIANPSATFTTVLMDYNWTLTAEYSEQFYITFSQSGVSSDFNGAVVTVDTDNLTARNIPRSYWWDDDSSHSFAFQSPLAVGSNKQYVWTKTSGLSTSQYGTLVILGSGGVVGFYKTQYYLTVKTNPVEVLTLNSSAVSGQGWYDSGTNASVDATQYVDKTSGQSEYDFMNWTGATSAGAGNEATVFMSGTKNATANYQLQYYAVQTVPPGTSTTVGNSTLGVSANVTTTTGSPTVTVANYTSNPAGSTTYSTLGKYVDVRLSDAAGVSMIEIRVYYTDGDVAAAGLNVGLLRLYFWDGTQWLECSDTGANTAANYIWAGINATSAPNLTQLIGTPFGGGQPAGSKSATGLFVWPVNGFAILVSVGLVVVIGIVAVRKRHTNSKNGKSKMSNAS